MKKPNSGVPMNIQRFLALLPVYLLFITTFALAGFGKLLEPGVPQWFADQFSKTFLAQFPGLFVSFYSIALLEALAAVLFVVSLLKGESLSSGKTTILNLGLLVSGLVFCQLGFGLRLVNEFVGAFNLFMYAVGTGVAYLYVSTVTKDSLQKS
jgi:hypothetical protein